MIRILILIFNLIYLISPLIISIFNIILSTILLVNNYDSILLHVVRVFSIFLLIITLFYYLRIFYYYYG